MRMKPEQGKKVHSIFYNMEHHGQIPGLIDPEPTKMLEVQVSKYERGKTFEKYSRGACFTSGF